MEDSTKSCILVILEMLKTTLKETNTVIGILVDKTDFNLSKIAFVNYESCLHGNMKDGFVVSPDELNKDIINQ